MRMRMRIVKHLTSQGWLSRASLLALLTLSAPQLSHSACGVDLSGYWVEDMEHTLLTLSKGDPDVLRALRETIVEPPTSLHLTRLDNNAYRSVYRETSFKQEPGRYESGSTMVWTLTQIGESCTVTLIGYPPEESEESLTTLIRASGTGFCHSVGCTLATSFVLC